MRSCLWSVFFFAALAMSVPAAGSEPDVVIRIEAAPAAAAPTAPCTDKPCVPVTVEPIRLVPAGASNPAQQPGVNPNQPAAPTPAVKSESGAPWWLWPLVLFAAAGLGYAAWRNRQAEAERERLAREAAERAANEARERRSAQEAEERTLERLRLVKAVEDANADFRRWRTADNDDRLRDALWCLARFDGTISCDPAGYTVSVPAGNLRVFRPFLAGGPQQVTPPTPPPDKLADKPSGESLKDKPADKPAEPPVKAPPATDKSKLDDKKGEDKPVSGQQMMSEGQERLLRKLLVDLGVTDKVAQDQRLTAELGPPDTVTRDQTGACIERFKAELVAKRAAEAEAQAKAKAAAAPAPTTTPLDPNAGQGGSAAAAAPQS